MKTKIKEIEGNLLDLADNGEFDLIGHGCNCQNTMGAGIALEIRKRYPLAYVRDNDYFRKFVTYSADPKLYTAKTSLLLGNFSLAQVYSSNASHEDGPIFTILNIYTQILPGANFDSNALIVALKKINLIYSGKRIGLPLIGCGIAGGDWNEVKTIIENTLVDMDVTIVHFVPQTIKKND